MEYEIGDIVQIRSWDDMEREFGIKPSTGSIDCPFAFTHAMKKFCGRRYTLRKIIEQSYNGSKTAEVLFNEDEDGISNFSISLQMIEPITDEDIPNGIEIPNIEILFS